MISDARKAAYDVTHPIFFDANVWLSLYAPPSDENDFWKGEYSKVLKRIVDDGIEVLVDSTVVSEYINRYCRLEFEAYAGLNPKKTFKQFRDSEPDIYKPIAHDAAEAVKERLDLPRIKRVDGGFATMDIVAMLDKFGEGKSDWNDQQIVDLCQRNKCSLLTNDADFKDAPGIDILTCNGKLLGHVKY